MNVTVLKAVVALVPAGIILCASAILFFREKVTGNLLQLLGASCLVLVPLAHMCEALQLFPSMLWGRPDSVGHYLDLLSAVLGLALFSTGYLLHALKESVNSAPR